MNIQRIQEKLKELELQIVKSYKNASILDDVCTLEEVGPDYQHGKFEQFASRFQIEKLKIVNPSSFLLLGELGLSVARSEITLLINQFLKEVPTKNVEQFSIESIKEVVHDLQDREFNPTTIFIPTSFYNDVFEWNRQQRDHYSILLTDSWHNLILDSHTILKIKYSSKYADFDDIIITSKDSNVWKYRPDIITGNRITAKFDDWEKSADQENIILLVRTIFNFHIENKEASYILKLPTSI